MVLRAHVSAATIAPDRTRKRLRAHVKMSHTPLPTPLPRRDRPHRVVSDHRRGNPIHRPPWRTRRPLPPSPRRSRTSLSALPPSRRTPTLTPSYPPKSPHPPPSPTFPPSPPRSSTQLQQLRAEDPRTSRLVRSSYRRLRQRRQWPAPEVMARSTARGRPPASLVPASFRNTPLQRPGCTEDR
jgi:hypothetical protein